MRTRVNGWGLSFQVRADVRRAAFQRGVEARAAGRDRPVQALEACGWDQADMEERGDAVSMIVDLDWRSAS